jgi:hypothetical protein
MELSNVTRLESTVIGCSLSTHWWGINKKAGVDILSSVADSFGANQKYLKIEKKLINRSNIFYKRLGETKSSLLTFWKDLTLPYVENGVRLIRKDLIQTFESRMATYKVELERRVIDLQDNYETLKQESRTALRSLYNEEDYPTDLNGLFSFYWEYPNLNPPEYLLNYNPELYRRQQEAVKAKFEEAIVKAEKAFGGELQNLVSKLIERMQPNPDGTRKVFQDSTVTENFRDFFDRFKTVSVTNSADLQDIISQAEKIISGVSTENLKLDSVAREDLATQMQAVSTLLESKIGVQPRRSLSRVGVPVPIPNIPLSGVTL